MIYDHDATSHAFGNREVCQGHGDETDQVEVASGFFQGTSGQGCEPMSSSSTGKVEPTCDDNHVRDDCDAQCHKIRNHEIDQYHRGKTEPIAVGKGKQREEAQRGEWRYPWTAPRVILGCLKLIMGKGGPSVWTIDDYDGEESWRGRGTTPPE